MEGRLLDGCRITDHRLLPPDICPDFGQFRGGEESLGRFSCRVLMAEHLARLVGAGQKQPGPAIAGPGAINRLDHSGNY